MEVKLNQIFMPDFKHTSKYISKIIKPFFYFSPIKLVLSFNYLRHPFKLETKKPAKRTNKNNPIPKTIRKSRKHTLPNTFKHHHRFNNIPLPRQSATRKRNPSTHTRAHPSLPPFASHHPLPDKSLPRIVSQIPAEITYDPI